MTGESNERLATTSTRGLGRREVLGILAGGAAVATVGALAGCGEGARSAPNEDTHNGVGGEPRGVKAMSAGQRMPVAYMPHGGGPWPFVEMGLPAGEVAEMRAYLEGVARLTKDKPKQLLVVSAHWEEKVPSVMTHTRPPMFFDYYGFPQKSYDLSWPAPGAPELAGRVRELLGAAGFETGEDAARGFDHGTFVPLMLTYPQADIPTTQLSLKVGLDPREHLAMGRALRPLRDEGVFILGSGMSYHDMRGFRGGRGGPVSEVFDAWLRETAGLEAESRDQRLATWTTAPEARGAHPREEHLLPLMVIAGAAGEDRGVIDYNGTFMGTRLSGYHFG